MILKIYETQLREQNLIRYQGKPPSITMVYDCIAESKLSRRSFEITFGIPEKTLQWYRQGKRNLPAVYWHIFYEYNRLDKFYSTFKVKKQVKKERKKIPVKNKTLIDELRAKLTG